MKTTPYGPRTATAVAIGWSVGIASFTAHAIAAAATADPHSFATYSAGNRQI